MNQPSPGQPFALGVDIGGTKMEVASIDLDGRLLAPVAKHYVPKDEHRMGDPLALIALLRPYVEQAKAQAGFVPAIGLSLCGNVDRATGMSTLNPNLGWRYLPFGQMLTDAFDLAVYAATDVRMAALGEAVWGQAQTALNFAWATIGTGYGGFLFLNGELYDGSHGFAGNFGHNIYDETSGVRCGCGQTGCFESHAAGPAIARAGQAAVDAGESTRLAELAGDGTITTPMVFQAEQDGDPAARAIIERMIRLYAITFSGLVNILDLDMIVVGGGVTHGSPNLIERIDARTRDFLMTAEARRDLQIVGESFSNSALHGAAASVLVETGLLSLNPTGRKGGR